MKAITKFLAGGVAIGTLAIAAPAAAQMFPGYGMPGYGYGGGYGMNSQQAVSQCTAAVQARLSGGYGYGNSYNGFGGGRVLGVSRVEPRPDGVVVHGVAASGRYAYGYRYNPQSPDLTWRCRTDFRGFVVDVSVRAAQPAYGGYGYPTPYGGYDNDYSQYGYQRY